MVILHSRCGHYIFALWFLSSSSSFFPRLILAIADWMSTILPHMVWPWCKFRMHVWIVLHAARWKCRTQKIAKNAASGHVQLCWTISSQLRHVSTIGKNLLNSNTTSTCSDNTMNFGPLAAEICWRVWGTPVNFNGSWQRYCTALE